MSNSVERGFEPFHSKNLSGDSVKTPDFDNYRLGLPQGIVHSTTSEPLKPSASTHDYLGAAANVGNGMISEVLNHPERVLANFAEGAVAGAGYRFLPPSLRVIAGGVAGAAAGYEALTNVASAISDMSVVANPTKNSPVDVMLAQAQLETFGSRVVDAGAGFSGFSRGLHAPEYFSSANSLRASLPRIISGELKLGDVITDNKANFNSDVRAIDWNAKPEWPVKFRESFKSVFQSVRDQKISVNDSRGSSSSFVVDSTSSVPDVPFEESKTPSSPRKPFASRTWVEEDSSPSEPSSKASESQFRPRPRAFRLDDPSVTITPVDKEFE